MVVAGQEVLGHGFHAGFPGHEHVHLPGEMQEPPDLVQFLGRPCGLRKILKPGL